MGTGDNINETIDLVFINPLYDMRGDWNADNLKYDVSYLEDMTDIANIPRDVMKRGSHSNVFLSSLRLAS